MFLFIIGIFALSMAFTLAICAANVRASYRWHHFESGGDVADVFHCATERSGNRLSSTHGPDTAKASAAPGSFLKLNAKIIR